MELRIRNIQFGTGLVSDEAHDSLGPPHSGLSQNLYALAAYLDSIDVSPSPYSNNSESIKLGEELFNALGCQSCHAPPLFADLKQHDVRTGDPARERNSHGLGTNFDTPSLRGVWMTAPYFHDGSAASLQDVFQTGTDHNIFRGLVTDQELEALIAYVQALPLGEAVSTN